MKKLSIRKLTSDIDMAPLIDVVFLLLMFFMLTSTFQRHESITIELPEAKTSTEQTTAVTVVVKVDGSLMLDGKQLFLTELGARVQAKLQNEPYAGVMLYADAQAPIQRLIHVMDTLQQSGIANIAIATQSVEL